MIRYIVYWGRMIKCALTGGRDYRLWMGFLGLVLAAGAFAEYEHIREGLAITSMTDQVPWGIGIANFVYFVGVAAGAAVIVVPAYAYHRADMKEVVFIAELLAATAVLLCMLFITSDVGRPERMWHLMPGLGMLNLPQSMLGWDVMVFFGYLLLNLYIPGYLLYKRYLGQTPSAPYYKPLVFLSMGWAVSIHTVTAFLLAGLVGRTFWNSAVLAPRFLVSAGASAPAILILLFTVVRRKTKLYVADSVFEYLAHILRFTLPANFFLIGCEVFQAFYAGGHHSVPAQYLFFGIRGNGYLPAFIWPAIALEIAAAVILLTPKLRARSNLLFAACTFSIVGVWVEKGMGLLFPGFIPSQLGEMVSYVPSFGELLVCFGVLALGMLLLSAFIKIAVAILTGDLHIEPLGPGLTVQPELQSLAQGEPLTAGAPAYDQPSPTPFEPELLEELQKRGAKDRPEGPLDR